MATQEAHLNVDKENVDQASSYDLTGAKWTVIADYTFKDGKATGGYVTQPTADSGKQDPPVVSKTAPPYRRTKPADNCALYPRFDSNYTFGRQQDTNPQS